MEKKTIKIIKKKIKVGEVRNKNITKIKSKKIHKKRKIYTREL